MSEYADKERRQQVRRSEDEAFLREIAHEAGKVGGREGAKEAVSETFRLFGVDIGNQESVNKFRSSIIFAGEMKKRSEAGRGRLMYAVITLAVGGAGVALYEGVKTLLGRGS